MQSTMFDCDLDAQLVAQLTFIPITTVTSCFKYKINVNKLYSDFGCG